MCEYEQEKKLNLNKNDITELEFKKKKKKERFGVEKFSIIFTNDIIKFRVYFKLKQN